MMSNEELALLLQGVRRRAEERCRLFKLQIDDAVRQAGFEVTALIRDNGRGLCPRCKGAGSVATLNPSLVVLGKNKPIGCPECGGNGADKVGRGFVTP